MATPVVCPLGTWTQIAPAGFNQAMIRFGFGAVRLEYAPSQPADTDTTAGVTIDAVEAQKMPLGLYPLRTGNANNAVWIRPVSNQVIIERLF